ncbi:MAG TPA: hypothetical protein VFV38_49880, partial [Ktedonobacteraceae bacterium]|nr:hypothetical protein [Ktedonobacteraceae bacterium]
MMVRPNLLTYCLARGSERGTLSVSRILDGVILWSGEHAHQGVITALAWSPDGQMLASGGQDGMVRVWRADTGDLLHLFTHGEPVRRLRWSPHGMLASTSSTTIHVWSLAVKSAS